MGYGKLSKEVIEDKESIENMKNIGQNMAY